MAITTNNVPRLILNSWDLTPKELEDLGYDDASDPEGSHAWGSFFRYKGEVYDLGDFEVIRPQPLDAPYNELLEWHGSRPDSFFSGLVVKIVYVDMDSCVVVGRYSY